MGRSASPSGPFIDKNGVDMKGRGGTVLIDTETLVMDGEFKLQNPKRVHYFKYKDQEYLSL